MGRWGRGSGVVVLLVVSSCSAGGTADVGSAPVAARTGEFACTPAPDDAQFVVTGAEWEVGEQRALTVGSASSVSRAIDPVAPLEVSLTAIDAGGSGPAMAWESAPTVLDDLVVLPGTGAELAALGEVVPSERVVYDIDRGVFAGVRNVDEIRSTVDATLDVMAENAALDFHSSIRVRMTLDGIPDDRLADLYATWPQTYHQLDGFTLVPGDPVDVPTVLPNGLGGAPFPAVATVEVTDFVDADGCVSVQQTVVPEPEGLRRVFAETLAARGIPVDGEPFEEALAGFSIGRVFVGQYDFATGLLWRLSGVQSIETTDQQRFDTTVITDVTVVRDAVTVVGDAGTVVGDAVTVVGDAVTDVGVTP